MVHEDPDAHDLVELVDDLAPGDQEAFLREVAERLDGDAHGDGWELTEERLGHLRDRFVEDRLTDDYEALGEQLTQALLTKAERELAACDEPVDRLEFDVEVQVEPIDPPPVDEYCVRFCIVNGILEPVCWQTCLIDGIFDPV